MNAEQYDQLVHNAQRRLARSADPVGMPMAQVAAGLKLKSESPIEALLAGFLDVYLLPRITYDQQRKVPGRTCALRVDFMLTGDGLTVVLEADGKKHHKARDDELRDYELLGCAGVDEVWHFPGGALTRNVAAAMARFILTHRVWFRDSVDELFQDAGLAKAPAFTPVTSDGWHDLPTPRGGRTPYRGTVRRKKRATEPVDKAAPCRQRPESKTPF